MLFRKPFRIWEPQLVSGEVAALTLNVLILFSGLYSSICEIQMIVTLYIYIYYISLVIFEYKRAIFNEWMGNPVRKIFVFGLIFLFSQAWIKPKPPLVAWIDK